MKLGIDIDGTIKQTHQAAIKVYNEELKMNVKAEEVTTFYLDKPFGLSSEEGKKMWRKLEGKIYSIGIPLEHAPEALQQIERDGHEIFYVTARPGFEKIRKITVEWLQKHHFPYNGKNLYMNAQHKGKIAKKLGIDLFFEDDPYHIDKLREEGISTVIMDMHYNRDYGEKVPRINNWVEGIAYIRQFEKRLSKID